MTGSLPARVAQYSAVMCGLGLACCAVAQHFARTPGLEAAVWPAGLCLATGWAIFGLERIAPTTNPALRVMAGSTIRMLVIAGCAVLLTEQRPDLPRAVLLSTFGVMYLGALAYETFTTSRELAMPTPPNSPPRDVPAASAQAAGSPVALGATKYEGAH